MERSIIGALINGKFADDTSCERLQKELRGLDFLSFNI